MCTYIDLEYHSHLWIIFNPTVDKPIIFTHARRRDKQWRAYPYTIQGTDKMSCFSWDSSTRGHHWVIPLNMWYSTHSSKDDVKGDGDVIVEGIVVDHLYQEEHWYHFAVYTEITDNVRIFARLSFKEHYMPLTIQLPETAKSHWIS